MCFGSSDVSLLEGKAYGQAYANRCHSGNPCTQLQVAVLEHQNPFLLE